MFQHAALRLVGLRQEIGVEFRQHDTRAERLSLYARAFQDDAPVTNARERG